jgi:hypothetical protein
MLKRFQAPYYDEGIDEIMVIKPNGWRNNQYQIKCLSELAIPHDNPHHTLSILEHCNKAKSISELYDDMFYAAWYHDIGKPYVKAFIDSKGNSCEYAHYYQHQCVGAWISYGLYMTTPKVAWLISTHMDPFMNTKYYNNLPLFLKKDIDLLHEADLNAH